MQSVSNTYISIVAGNHWFETKLDIDGVGTFNESQIFEIQTNHSMFGNAPAVGAAIAGEIDIKMLYPSVEIPPMACLRPYVRARNATQTSEWIPQGVYFIDTRERTVDDTGLSFLTIHGYDAMLKAEVLFYSDQITTTTTDAIMVKHIAKQMGLWTTRWQDGVDERTFDIINFDYNIPLPTGYTFREVLGYIAGMYGGSFIMSDEGKLRLVTMYELPTETNFLIDSSGYRITFGGTRIYV